MAVEQSAQLQQYPKFSKLFQELTESQLCKDGADKSLWREYEKSLVLLQTEKQNYLEKKLLHTEIKEIILDSRLQDSKLNSSNIELSKSNSSKINSILNCYLTIAETLQDFNVEATTENEPLFVLLGLSKHYFKETQIDSSIFSQQVKVLQPLLVQELEQRLYQKCEALASFFDPQKQEKGSSEFLKIKSLSLHSVVAKQKAQLEKEEEHLQILKSSLDTSFSEYYKVMRKSLEKLCELLQEQKLKHQFEYDELLGKWLSTRFDTMLLKLNVLKVQFLNETYTPQAVFALQKIRAEIDYVQQQKSEEHTNVVSQIESYEGIGKEFNKLVVEYAAILEQIQQKEWALSELQKDLK